MKSLKLEQAEKFGKVALLMGGESAEREISLKSGKAVFAALVRLGINAEQIDMQTDLYGALVGKDFDRVFNIIHGRGGEDGVTQGVLEAMNLSYTGSGVMASALTMDKLRTKLCWLGSGLPTPEWVVIKKPQDIDCCIEKLGFPVIVKPALEGSSLGMSRANNKDELVKAWSIAEKYQCDVYAEAWVDGSEYTVAILDGEALPTIRLETPNTFYDFKAKYDLDTTRYFCPSGLSIEQEGNLKKLAIEACDVVGVTGWGRVDVFIDYSENAQLIEVNTVPGMTDHSLVPMAAKAGGIGFDELVWRILETSLDE